MGTRSRIGIELPDGKVMSVYCHWDGYPSYNGKILLEHYQNADKVMQLISNGDMSTLGPEIGSKHDFNARNTDMCTFYGRDRGEAGVEAATHTSAAEMHTEEYSYLFKNGKWYYCDGYKDPTNFELLTLEKCKD